MFDFLRRLFRIGKAEAHNAVDKLENPLKMTKQGIRELEADLQTSMKNFAEVKATSIRTRKETEKHKRIADDYQKKAMALLTKAQRGEMDVADADRLAKEALSRREQTLRTYKVSLASQQKYEQMVKNMDQQIKKLKNEIDSWKNELRTLEARDKVSQATTKINKQLSAVDSSSTISMLEKMRERVENNEALAEAYGDINEMNTSVDEEIDKALDDAGASADLDALKRQMGLIPEIKEEKIEIKDAIEEPIKIENPIKLDADNDQQA